MKASLHFPQSEDLEYGYFLWSIESKQWCYAFVNLADLNIYEVKFISARRAMQECEPNKVLLENSLIVLANFNTQCMMEAIKIAVKRRFFDNVKPICTATNSEGSALREAISRYYLNRKVEQGNPEYTLYRHPYYSIDFDVDE